MDQAFLNSGALSVHVGDSTTLEVFIMVRWSALFAVLALATVAAPIGCATSTEAPESEDLGSSGEDENPEDELRAMALDDDDSGKTVDVQAGQNVTVKLSSNATTGYAWKVTQTDRSFGYPKETFVKPSSGAVGAAGAQKFTWKTNSKFALGVHTVKLEYRRSFEPASTPPAKTFTFTVNVKEAQPNITCANVRCAGGTHCEMKGINGGAIPVCIKDAPPAACVKTGCSGQICADGDVISTCEFRPQYACYSKPGVKCERQANGACGWSLTAAAKTCLGTP